MGDELGRLREGHLASEAGSEEAGAFVREPSAPAYAAGSGSAASTMARVRAMSSRTCSMSASTES